MNTQFSGKEIIALLRLEREQLFEKFGVVNIGLFGSFARGQATNDSDIDFIVELKEPRFDWLAGLQIHLEQKFNRRIEIVRKGNKVNSRFTKRVDKEAIYV
jgi:predicted nucleotidyltransferase